MSKVRSGSKLWLLGFLGRRGIHRFLLWWGLRCRWPLLLLLQVRREIGEVVLMWWCGCGAANAERARRCWHCGKERMERREP